MFKKYLFVILLAALVVTLAMAQSWNMGAFTLYTKKFGTNLELVRTPITLLAEGDTVYTDIIPIGEVDGIYKIEFSAIKYDTASTALKVWVAFYNSKMATGYKWTSWYALWTSANTEEQVSLTIDPADSTWWKPYAARQYRICGATDSCTIKLTDYVR